MKGLCVYTCMISVYVIKRTVIVTSPACVTSDLLSKVMCLLRNVNDISFLLM